MNTLWGDALPPEQPAEATQPLRQLTDAQILAHRSRDNPCVRVFGAGPMGKQCKTCAHLREIGGTQGAYFKCRLHSNGPARHRVRWAACGKYEEVNE